MAQRRTQSDVSASNQKEVVMNAFESRVKSIGIGLKASYSINDAAMVMGMDPQWIRKAITGYRGKGKRVAQVIKGKKDAAGVWKIPQAAMREYFDEKEAEKAEAKDRYEHPEKILADKKSSRKVDPLEAIVTAAAKTGDAEIMKATADLIKALQAAKAAQK